MVERADGGAVVVGAVGDERPAVVGARLQDVELVAAERAVLVLPQLARLGMERQPLRTAVAGRVDLGQVSRLAGKRVVGRRGAVVAQPQHLAGVLLGLLRAVLLLPLAGGEIEEAGAVEGDAAAVIGVRDAPGVGDEDVLQAHERLAVERRPRQRRGGALVLGAPLRVGQVDDAGSRRSADGAPPRAARPARPRAPPACPRSAPGRARRCARCAAGPAAR